MAGKCTHEESRLTCIECSSPICTNCMVQCPVGFRCKSCVGSAKNPVASGSKMLVAKTLAMCAAVGCAGGWMMIFITVPYISCIICFFLGLFAGRWLAAKIDYRALGARVGKIVVFGLLIGFTLSPVALTTFVFIETIQMILTGNLGNLIGMLNVLVSVIFTPVCYLVGVLRPTLWGEGF